MASGFPEYPAHRLLGHIHTQAQVSKLLIVLQGLVGIKVIIQPCDPHKVVFQLPEPEEGAAKPSAEGGRLTSSKPSGQAGTLAWGVGWRLLFSSELVGLKVFVEEGLRLLGHEALQGPVGGILSYRVKTGSLWRALDWKWRPRSEVLSVHCAATQ